MTYEINGSIGNSNNYGKNAVQNHIKHMEAPIVNDMGNTAPILNFRPTEEAVDNNIEALEDFANKNDAYLNSLPPLEYEYRYMPGDSFNKEALLGAAREEMGADKYTVEEFEERFLIDDSFTAKPLDINKDGNIDVTEYATNILATDLLSKNTTDPSKVDGVITTEGLNAILEYSKKSNAHAAEKLYSSIYNTYKLGE